MNCHYPLIRPRLVLILAAGSLLTAGCFSEHSFPMQTGDLVRLEPSGTDLHTAADPTDLSAPISTRQWLVRANKTLEHLLPPEDPRPLLTDDLLDAHHQPVDVFKYFHRNPDTLQSVFFNFWGLLASAQCGSQAATMSDPPHPWPGFEEVAIPISKSLQTFGWLGLAKDGDAILHTDCIVILPGLFGNNSVLRTSDLAMALVKTGFHVLAYENRGYGQSDRAYPDVPYNFGVLETSDLMIVSDWLEDLPYVRHTGVVGFCWSANQALLAAWYENCRNGQPDISTQIAEHLPRLPQRRRFREGVIAFSPTIDFEKIIEKLDTPYRTIDKPVLATMQTTIRQRMEEKRGPPSFGSLRQLIQNEFDRSELNYPHAVRDALRFLRLLPHQHKPAARKLNCARVPVLIVHASNDPMANADEIGELIARTDNPNVAALMLDGGGHVGFAAYARAYYYSLIINFFDPNSGAAAMSLPSDNRANRISQARVD